MDYKYEYTQGGVRMRFLENINGKWLIYKSVEEGCVPVYELMRIRVAKKDKGINGRLLVKKGEIQYPSSSEWGKYGWTTNSYERCKEIIKEKEDGEV